MTNEKAIRILTRLQICADTDACDANCEACQFNDDDDEIHEAIDMAIQGLKEVNNAGHDQSPAAL